MNKYKEALFNLIYTLTLEKSNIGIYDAYDTYDACKRAIMHTGENIDKYEGPKWVLYDNGIQFSFSDNDPGHGWVNCRGDDDMKLLAWCLMKGATNL